MVAATIREHGGSGISYHAFEPLVARLAATRAGVRSTHMGEGVAEGRPTAPNDRQPTRVGSRMICGIAV